ncbi:2-hydroxychromene-2-carboxylate isomerase [Pannonibacter tanglangensis]|uniref:2-hydroxychromene-2-carboxylate isomerase n=1 Tax=Pannonibacter tanglangensis TaxID=2750084 RepID=A0ABW9ZMH6_9HYPH|nr:2-hydroxychromene-2-carboxylate isomerase [Pannonibacter sp. XCT-34]NBN64262.1 2-hydroxychromene-2-carboxylate isomerase [Pannonibacter sp. XCT-34]
MTKAIDYFYTHISPWAYFGHQVFLDLAQQHGIEVRFRPVHLSGVFDASGGLPLARRHPVRQTYRLIELQRWREKRNLPLTIHPRHFPVDPTLADCCAIALAACGGPVAQFSALAFRAIWAEEGDLTDRDTVAGLLSRLDLDPLPILAEAEGETARRTYADNQALAIELGVIGSPCYVLEGEPFWGQDRLDLLADALASGRSPYRPV